ncbi:DUF6311 domain-containing protein [Candidatus Nanoperiomorbus periodonticus]|uniref:DUF6311 domain-containing protein n=1 Tax=Candidatus Nanoperiomorbus periodonticus TaxID=2171989 RepID=UPI00101BCF97|nr:DUF6311 domain-containing protein [Candidatus Nanoperiomorbus periodonticus]
MLRRGQSKGWQVFTLGALIGLVVFGFLYGFEIVNPTYTDWIWHSETHDTAQHQLGWEFYRAESSGGMIKRLVPPTGLSMVFMDVIPLVALMVKPLAGVLPANFQYFGLWGLGCYILMGGIGALLVDAVWRRTRLAKSAGLPRHWLAVGAGASLFVLSPIVLARSFYHPALAGQWIVLLGILLVVETPRFKSAGHLTAIWMVVLTGAILIHPYFLPMMGVLMVLSAVRLIDRQGWSGRCRWRALAIMTIIPAAVAVGIFCLVGGFSLGTGAEVYDLADKGFNLLSFANPLGYSVLPAFPNRSTSGETMMWLGLGVWLMLLLAAWLWRGNYRVAWLRLRQYWRRHRWMCRVGLTVFILLLVFAVGVRIDAGPATLVQYSVPKPIYELWSAFRASAREAWVFCYATILLAGYFFASGLTRRREHRHGRSVGVIVAMILLIVVGVQAVDILASPRTIAKRRDFRQITRTSAQFTPLDLGSIYHGQKQLIALDESFRGDQSGTYIIGRTALRYGMSLNAGFFARLPGRVRREQADWRAKLTTGQLTAHQLEDVVFFARDDQMVKTLPHWVKHRRLGRWTFLYV